MLYDIATKKIDLKELKDFTTHGDKLVPPKPVELPKSDKPEYDPNYKSPGKKEAELIIFGEDSDRIMYTLANCCKPIPGDDVFGFVTTGEGLKIHRTTCPNATRLMSNYGGELKMNISAMTIEAKEGIFEGNVKVFVHDKDELDDVVEELLKLDGIVRVDRYDIE